MVHTFGAGLIQILFYPITYIQLILTVTKKEKNSSPLVMKRLIFEQYE